LKDLEETIEKFDAALGRFAKVMPMITYAVGDITVVKEMLADHIVLIENLDKRIKDITNEIDSIKVILADQCELNDNLNKQLKLDQEALLHLKRKINDLENKYG
jgi:hypothetical protein